MGSIAYKIALVAKGNVDVALSFTKKNDWDLAAADLLVSEAGGEIKTIMGEKINYNTDKLRIDSVMAGNLELTSDLIKVLKNQMNQNSSNYYILSRIFENYVKKHSRKLIISIICMIIVSATTALNAWMMQPVLDDIFIDKNESLILIIPLAILLIAVVKGISSYIQSVLMSFVGYRLVADLQRDMFGSLIKCDISFFSKTNSGTLISRFLADVGALSRGVHNVIINIIKDFFTLFFFNWCFILSRLEIGFYFTLNFSPSNLPNIKNREKTKKNFKKYSGRIWILNKKINRIFTKY